MIVLDGKSIDLQTAVALAEGGRVRIASAAETRVSRARAAVERCLRSGKPHYGINTGFGYLAGKTIGEKDLLALQANLVRSHAGGSGQLLDEREARLALALRLNVFLNGMTGVRFALCEQISKVLNAGIAPAIPAYGSVGASGDLIPLAHVALLLMGEGSAIVKGKTISAGVALRKARIKPVVLQPKEGLSLINGTQVMLAVGALALAEALDLLRAADQITALSFEALDAWTAPLDARLHKARGHQGQQQSAVRIARELEGSLLWKADRPHTRVQDPYSLRCAPQVHGASADALRYVLGTVETELNAVTDNPLVFGSDVISGGNFHGQPLALAFDHAAVAMSEIASISERRLEALVNPHMSGLPPFLIENAGVQSGYMVLQYLAGSLVNENRVLAHPASVDSIPGNVGIEDHVSMGMTAARKLKQVIVNTRTVLGCELLAAAQGVDLRGRPRLGKGTRKTYELLRKAVPTLKRDRILSDEISVAGDLVRIMR